MHYTRALFALLILLATGVLTTWLPLGVTRVPIVLIIAALQAGIILFGLMRMRTSTRLAALAFSIGVLWLLILGGLSLSDFLTR